jgi:diguanylate cyclase (GGDEF)-like protein
MKKMLDRLLSHAVMPDAWRNLQIGTFAFTFAVIAVTWILTFHRLGHERQLAVDNALSSQTTLNIIVSENLRQILNRSELYRIVAANWFIQGESRAEARMLGMLAGDQVFSRVALFDLNGRAVFASSPSTRDAILKPMVGGMLTTASSGGEPNMLIGTISDSPGDAWQVPLMFPVAANGKITGALLLVLDLGYVLRLYQNIDIGETGIIHVLGKTGEGIVRAYRGGLELASSSAADPVVQKTVASEENWQGELNNGHSSYLASFQHLQPYPFSILVTQEMDDVLLNHDSMKQKYLFTLVFLTLVVLGSSFWITAMIRRQKESFNLLATSEEEKIALISQLEDEKRRALDMASQDHLTGLSNRRMFMELASSHLSRNKRSRQYSALLFIDLDRFKLINDTLGHHIGDLLLQTVASRLRALLRESDIVSRFGGDEFVLMLTGLEKEEDIVGLAQKVVESIAMPCHNLAGHNLQVLPSIGIAMFPRDGQDLDTLIHNADLAMYQSKQSKTGSYTFFDPSLNTGNVIHFELEQRFSSAIQNDEFVLHFQPKVELEGYRIAGLEALVRWQHPEKGLVFPGDFIPLAENTGHIIELGKWVINAACRQIAAWKLQNIPTVRVAVNVSAQQLRDGTLIDHLNRCLDEHGLDHEALEIEITESSLMENFDAAGNILKRIMETGVQIALDDFGNGFSSLGYIKSLPIDTIKIDRAFITDIRNSPNDAIIVTSTITLAHNLGKRVVAEGVETREQLVHLKTAGCDEVQGYYFSRPLPADKIQKLLLETTLTPK